MRRSFVLIAVFVVSLAWVGCSSDDVPQPPETPPWFCAIVTPDGGADLCVCDKTASEGAPVAADQCNAGNDPFYGCALSFDTGSCTCRTPDTPKAETPGWSLPDCELAYLCPLELAEEGDPCGAIGLICPGNGRLDPVFLLCECREGGFYCPEGEQPF